MRHSTGTAGDFPTPTRSSVASGFWPDQRPDHGHRWEDQAARRHRPSRKRRLSHQPPNATYENPDAAFRILLERPHSRRPYRAHGQSAARPTPGSAFADPAFGLEPSSAIAYAREWALYTTWWGTSGPGRLGLPGRDRPWDFQILYAFMRTRARTCRPSTLRSVLTMLKEGGAKYRHFLPTQKHEQPHILYHRIRRMMAQLAKEHRARTAATPAAAPAATGPRRATAVGTKSIGIVISALGATSPAGMANMGRTNAANIVKMAFSHTGALRHGHFSSRRLRVGHIRDKPAMARVNMITSWSKYPRADRSAEYTITFPDVPRWACQAYTISGPDGAPTGQVVTASQLWRWYVHAYSPAAHEELLNPTGCPDPRQDFQAWLRHVLASVLPSALPPHVIAAVTPHSMRAGFVTDNNTFGVPMEQTMNHGRWRSRRAFDLYDRAGIDEYLPSTAWGPGTQPARLPQHADHSRGHRGRRRGRRGRGRGRGRRGRRG